MNIIHKDTPHRSPQNYVDMDGNTRTFTEIDMDKKVKISVPTYGTDPKEEMIKSTERMINSILALPAVNVLKINNGYYEDFIERNIENGIIWREEFVRNALKINPELRYNIRTMLWKYTVRKEFWHENMSYDDILEGKWKEWANQY